MHDDDFTSEMTKSEAEEIRRSRVGLASVRLPRISSKPDRPRFSGGTSSDELLDQPDQSEVFQQVIAIIRWGVIALLIILETPEGFEPASTTAILLYGFLLLGAIRHLHPIHFDKSLRTDLAIIAEVIMGFCAVGLTGFWESPFAVTLALPIIVAGFARGYVYAVRVAVLSILLPTALHLRLNGFNIVGIQVALQWAIILIICGLIAGQTRRITGEARRQRSLAMNRMERLTDANSLLYSLHRVAQTLPASLDLNDVLETTIGRMRSLFDYETMALLVFDETDASWQVMRSEGASMPLRLGPTELPNPLKTAIAQNRLVDMADLKASKTTGLSTESGSGLYTTLTARGQIIGLLALESPHRAHYDERTVQMLNGFVDPVALAVDNARWFGRLRTMGAEEERSRIARDLHDRIGQSMAFLAFETDRLIKQHGQGKDIGAALDQLQHDVREVIREIRDTLSDLRTDVSDQKGLEETITDFAARVAERSGLRIEVEIDSPDRLPIMKERELWRIAQEAIVNVERHADATNATVRWISDGEHGVLEINDDGRGFTIGESGRIDSYGLVGMRERAASIGASFEVSSSTGGGTSIRCSLSPEQGRLAA